MMPLSLGNVTLEDYHICLQTDHWVSVTGQILDLNHNYISDFSSDIWEGQVNVDGDAEITRNCSLKVMDPTSAYGLDSRTPMYGALYYDRMVRIVYTVWAWWMANPVSAVVFCGPISDLNRDGVFINLSASGKEVMALDEAWVTRVFKKNATKLSVVKGLMVEMSGESRYDLPSYAEILKLIPADINIGKTSVLWKEGIKVTGGANLQMFYDGRGTLRLRQNPMTSVFTFRAGRGGSLITDPKLAYDDTNVKNVWQVKGGKIKGKTIDVFKMAPASHALNPFNLGRSGKGRYKVGVTEDTSINSVATANKVAQSNLDESLLQGTNITGDTLVIPHLDPLDYVDVQNEGFSSQMRLRQFSIPLVDLAGSSSIGHNRKVTNRLVLNRPSPTSRQV